MKLSFGKYISVDGCPLPTILRPGHLFRHLAHIPNASAVVSENGRGCAGPRCVGIRTGRQENPTVAEFLFDLLAIATKGQGYPEFRLQQESSAVVRGKNACCVRKD
jgi:hypothetical protein